MTINTGLLRPPFEIYHEGTEIADATGHICTAESPEYADAILAALRSAHASPDLAEAARLFTQAAQDAVQALNAAGLACPASIALAAEKARRVLAA